MFDVAVGKKKMGADAWEIVFTSTALASSIPLLLISVVLAIPLFYKQIYQRRNPIKSRGISTWIALAVHIITAITFISVSFLRNSPIGCFSTVLVIFPLCLVLYSSYVIQLFRYLVLGYVQQWKQKLHHVFFDNSSTSTEHDAEELTEEELKELEEEEKHHDVATPRKIHAKEQKKQRTRLGLVLLSKLASNWIYVLSAILCVLLWHSIFWPIFVATKTKDDLGNSILNIYSPNRCQNVFVTLSIAFTMLVVLHGVAIFGILVVVWICQWKKCCKLRQIFFDDDPFRFQLEAIALLFFNAIYLIVVDVVVIVVPYGSYFNALIIVLLYDFMNLLLMPGIPLMMTYYWDWRAAQRAKLQEHAKFSPSLETLVAICNDARLYQMFNDFAVKEFSIENLLCWKEIYKYQRLVNASEKRKYRRAKRIYELYLDTSSVMEVNIVQSMRDEVKVALQTYEQNRGLALPATLFDKIGVAVSNNLIDTYTRFHKSQIFRQYLEKA